MKLNSSKSTQWGKKILQKFRLRYLGIKDVRRFSKTASFSLYDASYDQLTSRIIYNVHAIEKGMSHTHNFRPGFGKNALSALNDALVIYIEKNYDKEGFAYIEGRSVIQKYLKLHAEKDADVSFISDFVDPFFLETNTRYNDAGLKELTIEEKVNNKMKSFYELSQGRSSVRDFSGNPVDIEKVYSAIQNATKTPSVCNRQGWSVYLVNDKKKIEKLLDLQHGFKGYPHLPEVVLAIAVSNSSFLSPVERNEAFVDGGLFSMSVLYGLEYEGLAAVALNAMMNSKDEKAIRSLLSIDESDQLSLFIAIGEFKDKVVVPISDRKNINSFIKEC